MNKLFKIGVVALIGVATIGGLSACSSTVASDIAKQGTAGQVGTGAKQIDNAQKSVVGESIANVSMMLEQDYAVNGVYTPVTSVEGIKTVTSDAGYIISGQTVNKQTAYRVSGSTQLYWFPAPLTNISELSKAGAVIPAGITTLP